MVALAPGAPLSPRPESILQTIHKADTLDVMVLSDGHFFLPTGALLTPDSPPAERDAVLKAAPPAGDQLRLPNNIAVIREPSTSFSSTPAPARATSPRRGSSPKILKAAGIQPAAVTMVVFTHGHPDHLWGVLDAGDNPIYPNATYVISVGEREVWSDPDVVRTLPAALANEQIAGGANQPFLAHQGQGRAGAGR